MLYRDYCNSLMHYGIKKRSGRYPYGSGERPYQAQERSRKMGFFARRKEKKRQKEILEQQKAKVEAQKKAAEEKAKLKAEKDEMLKSGAPTATMVKKYLSVITDAELQQAVTRMELLEKVEKYAAKENQQKSTFDNIDSFFNNLGKINKWGSTTITAYENVSKTKKYLEQAMAESQKKKKAATKGG